MKILMIWSFKKNKGTGTVVLESTQNSGLFCFLGFCVMQQLFLAVHVTVGSCR